MPIPRRRPELPTGVDDQVPYDQSGLSEEPGVGAPPPAGDAPAPDAGDGGLGGMDPMMQPEMGGMDLGSMGQEAPMDLGTLGGGEMAPPDQMGMGPQSPEDAEVEQMAAALDDPTVDPAMKAQIEQQLRLAAQRQLAGLGG